MRRTGRGPGHLVGSQTHSQRGDPGRTDYRNAVVGLTGARVADRQLAGCGNSHSRGFLTSIFFLMQVQLVSCDRWSSSREW
jgi:hypothetical protein